MPQEHSIPIAQRPPRPGLIRAILFVVVFDIGILCGNFTQLLLLPLRLLPFVPYTREAYERGIQWTKGGFGSLLILMSQWFAPTKLVITYEGSEPVEDVLERDADGNVTRIHLPEKLVIMANHQVYADWWYIWCLTYYMGSHDQILIILKKSLKHIPFVGWGMQFFRFLFLARSWSEDRVYLGLHLDQIAKRAQSAGNALALIIFPEGTLVSKDTRPLSKKYADKTGIEDMRHLLLPRSTGLLFLLRSLAPPIPSLHLLDITIGYPGIPPMGYGQDYYTLRSIFMQGIPPPEIHVHLRLYTQSDIPFGNVSADDVTRGAEASPEEAAAFDKWLRERWEEKDRLMEGYHRDGRFTSAATRAGTSEGDKETTVKPEKGAAEIPLRLRSKWEILNAFEWFAPVFGWYVVLRSTRWVQGLFA